MPRGRGALAVAAAAVMLVGPAAAATPSRAAPSARLTGEEPLDPVYGQGIARFGNGWILSGDNVLGRVDGQLHDIRRVAPAIPAEWAARGFNHVGDVDAVKNVLYAPLEQPDYTRDEQAVAWYDARTLAFRGARTIRQHEASFVTVDPKPGFAYMMDRFDGRALERYDLAHGWKRLRPLELDRTVQHVQGADVAQGAVWLSTDDPGNGLYRVDVRTGHVDPLGTAGHVDGEGEGIDATALPTGLLHVLTRDVNLTPVWLGNLAIGGSKAVSARVWKRTATGGAAGRRRRSSALAIAAQAKRPEGKLDPSWPPVLILAGVALVAAAAAAAVVVLGRARAAARDDAKRGRRRS